jgi:hypothetical protein
MYVNKEGLCPLTLNKQNTQLATHKSWVEDITNALEVAITATRGTLDSSSHARNFFIVLCIQITPGNIRVTRPKMACEWKWPASEGLWEVLFEFVVRLRIVLDRLCLVFSVFGN